MTVNDFELSTRTDYAWLVGAMALMLLAAWASTLTVYGWLLNSLIGIVALLVSLRIQQNKLWKVIKFKIPVTGTVGRQRQRRKQH